MATATIEYVAKAEAQVVRQRKTAVVEAELGKLVKKNGTVSQEIILAAAKDVKHPLHDYFDWDDTEAANKWRLQQATSMIMATRFVCFLNEERKAKKVESIVTASRNAGKGVQVRRFLPAFTEKGFRERSEVLAVEEARKSFVERKLAVLRGWCDSVIDVVELAPVRQRVIESLNLLD